MMTLLIEADASAGEPLARTLAALIPAVVEGVVLDAIVINRDDSAAIAHVADAAGAVSMAGGDLSAALEQARGDWLLCLEPGARLHDGWDVPVLAALSADSAASGSQFRFRAVSGGLKDLFRRPRALRSGLIIHKRRVEADGARTLEALARGRAARRLAVRISVADP